MPKQTQRCCHASTENSDFFNGTTSPTPHCKQWDSWDSIGNSRDGTKTKTHKKDDFTFSPNDSKESCGFHFNPRSLKKKYPQSVAIFYFFFYQNWLSMPGSFYGRSKVSFICYCNAFMELFKVGVQKLQAAFFSKLLQALISWQQR